VPFTITGIPKAWTNRALASTTHIRSQNPAESRALSGMAKTMKAIGNAEARAHRRPPANANTPHVKSSSPKIETRACSATNPIAWMSSPPAIAPTDSSRNFPGPSGAGPWILRLRTKSHMLIPSISRPCWVSDLGFIH